MDDMHFIRAKYTKDLGLDLLRTIFGCPDIRKYPRVLTCHEVTTTTDESTTTLSLTANPEKQADLNQAFFHLNI